jgi:TPR repeat protein
VLTKGEGVNKSLPQAHFWWRKASQASYPPAMFYLGMSLLETAPNSHAEAFQLFEKAAYLGSLDAMVGLGYCYENGRGVPRDRLAAEKWYASAAARGDREAQQSLKRIRTVLEQ